MKTFYLQGQTESKKHGKTTSGAQPPQTKGTAMSFGFKKKLLYSTSGAKKHEEKERQRQQLSAEITATDKSAGSDSNNSFTSHASANGSLNQSDDNGNTTASVDTSSESRDSKRLSTPKLTPPRKESTGGPYRSIRFGFRQANAVRPASTGLNPTVATYENASNNNNGNHIDWSIFKNKVPNIFFFFCQSKIHHQPPHKSLVCTNLKFSLLFQSNHDRRVRTTHCARTQHRRRHPNNNQRCISKPPPTNRCHRHPKPQQQQMHRLITHTRVRQAPTTTSSFKDSIRK